jgi:hypothetical protein
VNRVAINASKTGLRFRIFSMFMVILVLIIDYYFRPILKVILISKVHLPPEIKNIR